MNLPFTEKYRAKTIDNLVLKEDNKNLIINLLSEENVPNLFLYSYSAGTGKTSLAKIIIEVLSCDKLVLNASDERGIDTIREKVSAFCKTRSMISGIKKCVFLDEADYLTSQAQASLRNLMEEVSSNAFFILTANYKEKVIEPVKSRCISIDFNSPPKEQLEERLYFICQEEEIEIAEDTIEKMIKEFYPDIRSMVYSLQAIKLGKNYDEIFNISDMYKETVQEISNGKFDAVRQKIVNDTIDVKRFVKWLFETTVELNLPYAKIAELCLILSDIEKYIVQGVTPKIIFLANLQRLKKCLTIV